jgi:hypothetical protein
MHVSTRGNTDTSGNAHGSLFPAGHLLPFVLVTALFFLWGIPNNLNDVLIRQFMKSFAISRFQALFYSDFPRYSVHARSSDEALTRDVPCTSRMSLEGAVERRSDSKMVLAIRRRHR